MSDTLLEKPTDQLVKTGTPALLSQDVPDWRFVTSQIRRGDTQAFETYYEKFFRSIYSQVRQFLQRDEATCLDVVQEVMLKIIRSIKPIEHERQLAAWTRAVTQTVTYDWLRKEVRRNRQTGTQEILSAMPQPTSENELNDQARLAWLEQELKQLPAATQKMISLRYRMGWSLSRIGEAMGLKTGAVDGRIRRAIEQLRKKQDRDKS